MKTRNILVLAAMAVAAATAVQAELAIAWTNPNGYYDSADALGAAEVTGGGIYGALILTMSDTVGVADIADLWSGGTLLAEGDLAALGAGGGNVWGWGAVINAGGDGSIAYTPGSYVFARVFEASTFADIGVGTWYYDGPVVPVEDKDLSIVPSPLPQVYNANIDSSSAGFGDALNTAQVVPEPATLALLGLGMLAAFLRRRS